MAMIILWAASPQLRTLASLPDHIRLVSGDEERFNLHLPLAAIVSADKTGVLALDDQDLGAGGARVAPLHPFSLRSLASGHADLTLRLFGLIPLRHIAVDVVRPLRLVPGGHSIGVVLRSKGVVVVGFASVRDETGRTLQPGREAGLELGDSILRIGGHVVQSEEHASKLVQQLSEQGRPLDVELLRKGQTLRRSLQPVKDKASGQWRIGLYIRDGAAGVGTLTFYDPVSKRYGALGHVIADNQTGQPIVVRDGHIVSASISGIDKGQPGVPGEKVGVLDEQRAMGNIELNGRFGIFGVMRHTPKNPFYSEPIPVGMASQVQDGDAEIITVTRGNTLDRFKIRILRVVRTPQADGKSLVIKIVDQRLLHQTRGIVQGMSGSPIIQGGRLVGAVTHVFVNDPTRGYGVLIEQMLGEAGLLEPAA